MKYYEFLSSVRMWLELTTYRSGGERSTFTLPVGKRMKTVKQFKN